MDGTIQLKIEFENSLRRASVNKSETTTLAKLKQNLCALIGVADCDIKYRDEDNDLITVGSDLEVQDLLQAGQGKVLRLIVTAKNGAVPVAEPARAPEAAPAVEVPPVAEPEPEPEIPWANLARALAQPEVVARVQQVLQSPVLTEAITRAAQGYVDSKGDVVISALMASQQLPSLMGVVAELMDELPVLKDLQTLIMHCFQDGFPPAYAFMGGAGRHGPPRPGPHCGPHPPHHGPGPHPPHHGPGPHPPHHGPGPHCGPHPPHHGGPGPHCGPHPPHGPSHHGHHHHGPNKHFGVFCDGCGSDAELKRISMQAGHQTRRGFIRGLRYKSQTVHDFDLCESCQASGRFPDRAYGPFTQVQPQQHGPGFGGRGPCGGRGGNPWFAAAPQQPAGGWRCARAQAGAAAQQQSEKKTEEEPQFDFLEAIRSAVSRGTEAFVEATKNESNDFGDIARAIAESLKEPAKPAEIKKEEATAPPAPPAAEDWVPVATPTTPPKEKESEDPFVKWATQLGQLEALGFDRTETYITFLEEEKGDLDRVVSRIVSRDL